MTAADACWLLLGLGGFAVCVGVAVNIKPAIDAIERVHTARKR